MHPKDSVEVVEESSMHHYRTEIPNIIFSMGLEPYAFKAYCILKMTAGDRGSCFKSNETLCAEIMCKNPKWLEIKKLLVRMNLIKIKKRRAENGRSISDLITIVDLWHTNMETMSQRNQKNNGEGNLGLPRRVIYDYPEGNLGLPKQDHKEQDHKRTTTDLAAVSFDKDGEKKKEPAKPKTYECLEVYPDVGDEHTALPRKEKIWITKKYDEETAKNAILWAANETKPFDKGLAAAIKWACKERPQIAKNAVYQKEENRAYALKYDGKSKNGITIEVLSKYVSFNWTAVAPCFCLEFDVRGFKEQFIERLRKNHFEILE